MAGNDKLWFEMGVRENVSKVLADLMDQAETIQERLSNYKIPMDAINNAAELERALDKIAVAQERISEAKGLTSDKDTTKRLNDMSKALEKASKRIEKFSKMSGDDFENMGIKGMAKFIEEMYNLSLALQQVKRETGEINAKAKEDERNKLAEERRIDSLKEKYYELYHVRRELQDAILSAPPGVDISNASSMLASVTGRMGAVTRAQTSGIIPTSVTGAEYSEFLRGVKDETRQLSSATDEYNKKLNTTENIYSNLERMSLDTQSQRNIAGIRKQAAEYKALEQKLRDINDLMNRVNAEKQGIANGTITTPTYTRDVVNKELEAINRRYNESLAQTKQLEKEDAEAKSQKAAATKKAADAVNLLAHLNGNLINSYNRIAEAGSRAHGITVQIQQQIAGYAGLYGIERILKSVITIGGQFEYQHKALQNILGDMQAANTLFSQLQDLAIESPKTFMELTSYTKQLAAYQIPAEELFDTTKRLADLSSGLGVDMSRLILAFGQVRSAAVLRGQELRQFTEAGIPMVQALADEFTKLNGRVVTTGEVFELISKRAVPFEMVKKVMWDMTNEGGRFYNMQSELADTLYGKWQKLQDQWQITLGHIADANTMSGSFLKNTLEFIVAIAASLDKLLPVLGMFGIGKLAKNVNAAYKSITENSDTKAMNTMLLAKNQEALRLEKERLWYGKKLEKAERDLVAHKNELVASDYQLLAAENKISAQKAQQLLLDGKIERAHFYRLLQMQGYTREQRKQIANNILLGQSLKNEKILGGPETALKKFGRGIWSLIGGWWGLAFSAIGGIMSAYSNASAKAAEAMDISKGAANDLLSDLKEANALYNELSKKAPQNSEEYSSAINKMTYSLKESGHYTEEFQKKLDGTADITEKYTLLYNELQKISDEYLRMKNNVEAYLEAANRVGEGNWFTKIFNDPMSNDIKQWSEANIAKNVAKRRLDSISAVIRSEIEKFIKDNNKWNEEAFKNLNWEELFGKLTSNEKSDFKVSLGRKAGPWLFRSDEQEYWADITDKVEKFIQATNVAARQEREVNSQMEAYRDNIFESLEGRAKMFNLDWSKMEQWTPDDLKKVSDWINDIINSYNLDKETADALRKKIIEGFPKKVQVGLELIPEQKKAELSAWQQSIANFFKENKINVPISVQSSLKSIEKDLKNKRKELQEQMDVAGKILISVGLDLSNLPQNIESVLTPLAPWRQDTVRQAYTVYTESRNEDERTQRAKQLGFDTNPKSKTTGRKEDKKLKEAQTLLEEVKKFYSEYKKYREVYGAEKGQSIVEGIFGIGHKRANEIINNYKSVINDILAKLPDNGSEARKKWKLSGKQLLGDIDLDAVKQVLDKDLKELQEYINKQTESWNLYKSLFEKTGNKDFAYNAFRNGQVWDDLSREMADELTTRMSESNIKMPANIWDMTSAQAEEYLKNVKGGHDLWKKVVDLLRKGYTDALTKGADAVAQQLTISDKIRKNEEEIAKLRSEGAGIPGNSARISALEKENDKLGYEAFQQSVEYLQFFGAVLSMTNDEMERVAQTIKDRLLVELSRGTITSHQYIKGLKDVNNQLEKGRVAFKGNFMTFLSGGQKGIVDLREQEVANAVIAYEDAKKHREELEKQRNLNDELGKEVDEALDKQILAAVIDEEDAKKRLDAVSKTLGISMKTLEFLQRSATVLNIINGALDGLQSAANGLSEMFQALGNDDAANTFSDIADTLGGISGIFKPITNIVQNAMSGNISGIVGSAISAPVDLFTGPITAFAKLHDKQLQREIDASKARQQVLDNFTKNLEKVLERTLGGVYRTENSTEGRRKLQEYMQRYGIQEFMQEKLSQITGTEGLSNEAKKFYQEVYKAFNKAQETNTYYDTQRAFLYAQRYELERQLSAEEDKKDSDESAIANYRQQIQELDEQIKYFALDMADSLYDINLQSWAKDLTDAIVSAWENGEDAAEAYKNKVKDIMKELTTNILSKKVLEIAFDKLGIDDLIVSLMDTTSGMLDKSAIPLLAERLNEAGQMTVDAITATLDELEKQGYISKGEGSSSTSSKVIQGGFTENETGLLLSYINGIRGDVSVNRATLQQILVAVQNNQRLPVIAEAQLQQLQTLVSLARQRTIFVSEIRDILHNAQTGAQGLKVN